MKRKIVDLLIVSLIYIFFSSFPYDIWIKDANTLIFIQSLSKLISFVIVIIFATKSRILVTPKKKTSFLVTMILIPTFIMVFNNLIYSSTVDATPVESFDGINLLANLVFILVTAITEEYIFRYLLLNNLDIKNKLIKVLIAGLVFGLFHVVTFLSTFNPFDLIQIVYTTGLGIVLAFYYEFSKGIVFPIIFHFLFNFFNSYMYSLYIVPEPGIKFFVVSGIDGIIVLSYLALIYFAVFKKYYSIIETEE